MYSFPLEDHERILKKSLANLYFDGDVLHGAMYLTTDRLVFVGFILDISHRYMKEVPLSHIAEIKPEKTFFFIPNVLSITTIQDQKLKFVVSGRDTWMKELHGLI